MSNPAMHEDLNSAASPGQEMDITEPDAQRPLLWVLTSVVGAFVIWAAIFKLDAASYAQGQVVPDGQLQKIQHLEGGIIKKIQVSEGQQVKAGDVIAELEDESPGADVADIGARVAGLEMKYRRLQASIERAGNLSLPADLQKEFPAQAEQEKAAFQAYMARYRAVIQNHESRISQRKSEIQEANARLQGLQSRSKLVAEQMTISSNLLKQKLTNEYEHLQLSKEQAQINSDRDSTIASLERAKTGLTEAQASMDVFRREEEMNLRKEAVDISTELNSLKERLRKPLDSQSRTTVRAPVAGTIMTLYQKGRGTVVSPGGLVATLVPEGEQMLVEARLPVSEIGYVAMGSAARLSIASGGSGFSSIDAKVVHISPDATIDEKTGAPFYTVRLQPKTHVFRRGKDAYALRPGVQVMAAIITGERSVLAVLIEPFIGSGIHPLSER